jgi:hypothetical protein
VKILHCNIRVLAVCKPLHTGLEKDPLTLATSNISGIEETTHSDSLILPEGFAKDLYNGSIVRATHSPKKKEEVNNLGARSRKSYCTICGTSSRESGVRLHGVKKVHFIS